MATVYSAPKTSQTSAKSARAKATAQGSRRAKLLSEDGGPTGVETLAAWVSGWTSVSEEATRFASRRLERNIETAMTLSRCSSPMDMWTTWAEAAQQMAQDYVEELARMSETYVDAAKAVQDDLVESGQKAAKAAESALTLRQE